MMSRPIMDDGSKSNFGLISPRSPAGETNFQLDIDYIRIDADTGRFEAPIPEPGTGILLGLGVLAIIRPRRVGTHAS